MPPDDPHLPDEPREDNGELSPAISARLRESARSRADGADGYAEDLQLRRDRTNPELGRSAVAASARRRERVRPWHLRHRGGSHAPRLRSRAGDGDDVAIEPILWQRRRRGGGGADPLPRRAARALPLELRRGAGLDAHAVR